MWGKKLSDKCRLCGGRGSLLHILNMCPVALEQGRFTYRRNCVLAYLVRTLKTLATLNEVEVALYADLPGMGINGGTIPANTLPTS